MDVLHPRQIIFDKDERNGYIEREAAIHGFLALNPPDRPAEPVDRFAPDSGKASVQINRAIPFRHTAPINQAERYVAALEYVLERLSTPIETDDIILGRMVEGPIPYDMERVPAGGKSHVNNPFRPNFRNGGHMSLDYSRLLRKGLRGIAADAERAARTEPQKHYTALARRAADAVCGWAARWSEEAAAVGNERAAKALKIVPGGPAYDFYSAVQSVWLVEMILSCVTGGRDFAYSRLDLALLPYFREDESEDALDILSSFLLKNNEIGGLGSELNSPMPVPCGATNIYLMLGGRGAEAALPLDLLFVKAAGIVRLPQPIFALRYEKTSPKEWKRACMDAAQDLDGQAALYNDDILIPSLIDLGYSDWQAVNYTMSGCNRAEFPGQQSSDYFHNCAQWLLDAFYDEQVTDMDSLLAAFDREARKGVERAVGNGRAPADSDLRFNLESFLLDGCMENARDLENGGLATETVVHNLCGAATIIDSLAAIDTLVFKEKSISLTRYRELVKSDFALDPALHTRISLRLPKYGNDDPAVDRWAPVVGEIMANAVRDMRGERIHIPSFYSLFMHQQMGTRTGATPDGRLSGRHISENQSPVYGRDTKGVTALLRSVAALPQRLCGSGGLNIRFARRMDNALLKGLVETYFEMGGVVLAVSIVSRQTLIEARENPDRFRGLLVRVVGYSDVFVNLPESMQLEIIERTELAL